jgi:hypothetical protein
MAPTREKDRHGTPILISDSPPRSSRHERGSAAYPQGITKLPPRPPPLQEQGTLSGRTGDRVNNLQPVNRPIGVSGFGANSINASGQLLPSIPGLTYGLGPPPVLQPIPNIAKVVANDHGKELYLRNAASEMFQLVI